MMQNKNRKFRSKGEGIEYKRLEKLVSKSKKPWINLEYEPVRIPYKLEKEGIPDYVISFRGNDGKPKIIYLEYKDRDQYAGLHILDNRKKYIAMRDTGIDLRFIIAKPGLKISKTISYEDWLEKNNFKYYYAGEFTLEDL